MTNPVQPLDPISPPNPVTPYDTPSSPSDYAAVTPHGTGPAPYNIQAPVPLAEMNTAFNAANAANGAAFDGAGANGAGFFSPQSARQAQTETLMQSAQGFGLNGWDVNAGGTAGWPNDVEPPGM